jgi:hypothetical protein
MNSPDPQVITKKDVKIRENNELKLMASDLQDSLDIAGWSLFWKTSRDSAGHFRTAYQNPHANYEMIYHPDSSYVTISKTRYGFWRVFNTLHGFGGKMPRGSFIQIWGIYTYICLFVVLFSIVSGIWLWSQRKGDKITGYVTFFGILAFSFMLIIISYFHG